MYAEKKKTKSQYIKIRCSLGMNYALSIVGQRTKGSGGG